jgi:porin
MSSELAFDRVRRAVWICFVAFWLCCFRAECGPLPAPTPEPSPNSGFLEQTHSLTEERGVTISAEYTGEILGDVSGGIKTGATYEGLVRLGLMLDLKKLINLDGTTFYVSALYPHGKGISHDFSGDFNIASSIDAYNSFRLNELWLQQKLFNNDDFTIRVGQLAADLEFFLSANAALFVNSAFGTMPTISFNNKLPVYPVGGLGIRIAYAPTQGWFFRGGVFDANPGTQNTDDKHGVDFRINLSEGVIVLAEAGYAINSGADSKRLEGSYKVGGWYDSSHQETPQIIGQHSGDSGFYAIIDQMLYRNSGADPGSLSAFVRVSGAPQEDKNLVPFYIDGGFNLVGPFPSRNHDIFGMALGYTQLSSHFVPVNVPIRSGHETVFETSYKLQLGGHLFLQPDIQYILNPGGFPHLDNALVMALRFDITY